MSKEINKRAKWNRMYEVEQEKKKQHKGVTLKVPASVSKPGSILLYPEQN